MLAELGTLNEIAEAIESAKKADKLLLLKFGAKWCKPCKQIAPVIKQLVAANAEVLTGYEIDVDVVVESLVHFNVQKLPTFIMIHNGDVAKVWTGANFQEAESIIYNQVDAIRAPRNNQTK